eukprot:NODE_3006_length_996_cov_5.805702_g2512_i0.p1 GENE.NODE_3006_length_996_cov_5.805702_g2512_i0~~NODE_3006_length_996_cov_5.805702_g2512_i0.p1  ORF type:complete len:272 (-),score=62.02 NODE_3006_length_996_cov_5.805702_g2512_i0:51-866(-)
MTSTDEVTTGKCLEDLQEADEFADKINDPIIGRVLITSKAISRRVRQLAEMMARHYSRVRQPGQLLILICILKGSFTFTADLSRALSACGCPNMIEFMCISSYGSSVESSGHIRVVMDLRRDIYGHHCLIVEDICDSGRTLENLQRNLKLRQPASLRTVVLLSKPSRRVENILAHTDWVGFEIADLFVIGYGMDFDERGRDLPYLGVIRPAVVEALKAQKKDQSDLEGVDERPPGASDLDSLEAVQGTAPCQENIDHVVVPALSGLESSKL